MSRKSTAVLAIFGVVAIAGLMIGCGNFFVSENSLAQITVSPTAVLLDPGGTQTLAVTATLVNGTSSERHHFGNVCRR